MALKKKIFKFRCIFVIRYDLILEKGVALQLNIPESPSPNDALHQVWFE